MSSHPTTTEQTSAYELVCDQTKEVLKTGTYYTCLGKFQQVCGFSFYSHKTYSYDTYSIRPVTND